MRNTKKIIAAAMTGIMILAQGSVAFAATTGGFDANVDTEKAVLRVSVPTSMDIMVDQFEIGEAGVQINSDSFEMTNYSQMAVKVDVTSTVTLGSDVNLAASKAAAVASEGNDAWLAVAAATADDTYGEGIPTLDDTAENVDTFSASNTVAQTFYLSKGTGDVAYKLMIPAEQGKATSNTYLAEYYALTEASSTITDQDTLDAALASGDIYTTPAVAADGATVTLIKKGSSATYDSSTVKYYTMADTPTAVSDLAASSLYAYGATATAGAAAEFKYLGRLSDAKESWTKEDIKGINVAYTITGVTSTIYNKVSGQLTYGYLPGAEGGSAPVSPTPTGFAAGESFEMALGSVSNTLTLGLGSGSSAVTIDKVEVLYGNAFESALELTENTEYTITDGNKLTLVGTTTGIFKTGTLGNYKIRVTYSDADTTETTLLLADGIEAKGFASNAVFNVEIGSNSNAVAIDLGSGTKAVTISSVDLMYGDNLASALTLVAGDSYSYDSVANTITLLGDTTGIFNTGAAGTYAIRVTFSNGSTSTASCVCTQ